MAVIFRNIKVSSSRKEQIIKDISLGSEPKGSFYAMLLTSSLIAAFGLIANSTAVVIGAMLVSPLMTPILGISMALVRGDGVLMGHAVRSEVVGVVLAISVSAIFGMLPMNVEVTPEMLARTQPNLLDLLVAVLAGFAGAYAMIDERISPALPGVAIATAIVPPLSNCGLCLGLGAYTGAFGSFLLFFANFLSILLITAMAFLLAGLAPKYKWKSPWNFARRFGPPILGFILVGVFLTQALIGIVHTRRVNHSISEVLNIELEKYAQVSMDNYISTIHEDTVEVLAMIRAARIISPDEVKKVQDALSQRLKQNVQLVVRSTLAKDISATGGTGQIRSRTLNGSFIDTKSSRREQTIRHAEQVIWELLSSHFTFQLDNVDYGQIPRGRIIFATLRGIRPPTKEEIRNTEKKLRQRLDDDQITLIVRFTPSTLIDRYGEVIYGWTSYGEITPEKEQLFNTVRSTIRKIFKTDYTGLYPVGIHFNNSQSDLKVLIEVVGRGALTPEERDRIEKRISAAVRQPVKALLWIKSEIIYTSSGKTSFQSLVHSGWSENEEEIVKEWPNIR